MDVIDKTDTHVTVEFFVVVNARGGVGFGSLEAAARIYPNEPIHRVRVRATLPRPPDSLPFVEAFEARVEENRKANEARKYDPPGIERDDEWND